MYAVVLEHTIVHKLCYENGLHDHGPWTIHAATYSNAISGL